MLSSLFENRPQNKARLGQSPLRSSYTPIISPSHNSRSRYYSRGALRYEVETGSETGSSENDHGQEQPENLQDEETNDEENDIEEATPLLPIFNSLHLDTLPIYTLTHTIRLLVESRCDTVLTWEQLRSPQVSQFLVKPIEQEIRSKHFSAATLYCLMANCLQFSKEVATIPGNSNTIQTRAMVCELLALKLLREYTVRSLIDALSYDFDPLQGQSDIKSVTPDPRPRWQSATRRLQFRSARISCLEIAIRAEAKRFIAHPLVIQQLEAIWDGSIVFHAAADNAHHRRSSHWQANYGATGNPTEQPMTTESKSLVQGGTRKVVTLYNPREASLFKLSRLRVPRYRNILTTLSFAVLLILFVAVLNQRSVHITSLEVLFWFWAAGFMMDELVGFTEQGFGLYLASFWNTIDLGIVVILLLHLALRIYGIVMPDIQKRRIASMAFDVLAADAILLFPRLFSVLDHYRYFSQLIVAFRLMIADFIAVLVVIMIAFSGFFVALTLSFGYNGEDDASAIAYALLQMIFGFTPAVWDRWPHYTLLGRSILVTFLLVSHFLVLTILITVLTNSFMAVVKNAEEEHQFLFAVNTISSVKSDTLFSYVSPLNVLQWTLNPLRYVVSFKQYVKANRAVIKFTHFPVLFCIYAYEKIILQPAVIESIDVVKYRQRRRPLGSRHLPRLIQQPSRGNLRQDQALEEVFKQPFDATIQANMPIRKRSINVVNKWMNNMQKNDSNSRQPDTFNNTDGYETERTGKRNPSAFSKTQKSSRALSVTSDPEDLDSQLEFFSPAVRVSSRPTEIPSRNDLDRQDDTADGDDELQINDNNDDGMTIDTRSSKKGRSPPNSDYFNHNPSPLSRTPAVGSLGSRAIRERHGGSHSGRSTPSMAMQKRSGHRLGNVSSATMIFNPKQAGDETTDDDVLHAVVAAHLRPRTPGSKQTSSGGRKTPKLKQTPLPRPPFPNQDEHTFRSAPDLHGLLLRPQRPRRSSLEIDLVSDIGDNKAIGGGYVGAIPASFATQMASGLQEMQQQRKDEQQMFGRIVMARMNTLEEGFREVIHEMRENMRSSNPSSKPRSPERPAQVRREKRAAMRDERARNKERLGSSLGMSADTASVSPGESVLLDLQRSDDTLVAEGLGTIRKAQEKKRE